MRTIFIVENGVMGEAMRTKFRRVGAVGVALAEIGVLAILYVANSLSIYTRIVLAFASLAMSGFAIQSAAGLSGGYGFYMVGSRKGLATIDRVSKRYNGFWKAMAMWGMAMGFGIVTYPLVKGRIDKRILALGVLSLLLILVFVQPYLAVAFRFINLPGLQGAVSSRAASLQPSANLYEYALAAITAVFGFTGYIFAAILSNAASILLSVVQFLAGYASGVVNTSGIASQIPGIAPIIPGLDIPLIAGLISLIVLLVIHEFSHGVLSRIAKVRLKSIGLLAFGVIPVGAYVEPDESMVKKLGREKQTAIFSAGIAANFIATIAFFFVLLLLLYYVVPSAYNYGIVVTGTTPGYPANGILTAGMQVLAWNNRSITNVSSLVAAGSLDKPNKTVMVTTDSGFYSFRAVPQPGNSTRGIIGVELGYQPIIRTPYAKGVYFVYTLIALSMLLNFLVAVVNLLPVPGFDGWRIYKANIKNQKVVGLFAALIVAGIAINALPWLFYV